MMNGSKGNEEETRTSFGASSFPPPIQFVPLPPPTTTTRWSVDENLGEMLGDIFDDLDSDGGSNGNNFGMRSGSPFASDGSFDALEQGSFAYGTAKPTMFHQELSEAPAPLFEKEASPSCDMGNETATAAATTKPSSISTDAAATTKPSSISTDASHRRNQSHDPKRSSRSIKTGAPFLMAQTIQWESLQDVKPKAGPKTTGLKDWDPSETTQANPSAPLDHGDEKVAAVVTSPTVDQSSEASVWRKHKDKIPTIPRERIPKCRQAKKGKQIVFDSDEEAVGHLLTRIHTAYQALGINANLDLDAILENRYSLLFDCPMENSKEPVKAMLNIYLFDHEKHGTLPYLEVKPVNGNVRLFPSSKVETILQCGAGAKNASVTKTGAAPGQNPSKLLPTDHCLGRDPTYTKRPTNQRVLKVIVPKYFKLIEAHETPEAQKAATKRLKPKFKKELKDEEIRLMENFDGKGPDEGTWYPATKQTENKAIQAWLQPSNRKRVESRKRKSSDGSNQRSKK